MHENGGRKCGKKWRLSVPEDEKVLDLGDEHQTVICRILLDQLDDCWRHSLRLKGGQNTWVLFWSCWVRAAYRTLKESYPVESLIYGSEIRAKYLEWRTHSKWKMKQENIERRGMFLPLSREQLSYVRMQMKWQRIRKKLELEEQSGFLGKK